MQDFITEAYRIKSVNNWMLYTLPLHRIRECGLVPSCLACVSQRKLTPIEMRDYCIFLFGYESMSGILDPVSDWPWFLVNINDSLNYESEVWDPWKQQAVPLLDVHKLTLTYRPASRWRCRCTLLKRMKSLFTGH